MLADIAERSPRCFARQKGEQAVRGPIDDRHRPCCGSRWWPGAGRCRARVLLARRFHNDAVRDTLALRDHPGRRACT